MAQKIEYQRNITIAGVRIGNRVLKIASNLLLYLLPLFWDSRISTLFNCWYPVTLTSRVGSWFYRGKTMKSSH